MKGLLLASLPKNLDFYEQSATQFGNEHGAGFNAARLDEYSRDLESAGCVRLADFRVIMMLPNGQTAPPMPGFARLFAHPTRNFFAEVNQLVKEGAPPMACNITSIAAPDWSLETNNMPPYSADSITYAMRRLHAMWNRRPELSPRELMDLHLRQRDKVFADLGLSPQSNLDWNVYAQRENQACDERRAKVQNASTLKLMFDIFFSKGKRIWWGEYSQKFPNNVAALNA